MATAYLREELHPSSHARAAGLYIGGTALGGMAGRLVTGAVAEAAGWRWALAAAAVLGLACALAVRLLLPASRNFVAGARRRAALLRWPAARSSDPALLALYAHRRLRGRRAGGGVQHDRVPARGARPSTSGWAPPAWSSSSTRSARSARRSPAGSPTPRPTGRAAGRVRVAIAGLLLTLRRRCRCVVLGLALLTAGFFAVHGVASGWVPARAHAGGVSTGQAASLYLFTYYLGSSVFGTLAGHAWSVAGWPGVVGLATLLLVLAAGLALLLRRTPTLLAAPTTSRPDAIAASRPH